MDKIISVHLHGAIHNPDVGQIGPTLTSTKSAQKFAYSLELKGDFIRVSGVSPKGKKFKCDVPMTNVANINFEANESKSSD